MKQAAAAWPFSNVVTTLAVSIPVLERKHRSPLATLRLCARRARQRVPVLGP